MLISIKKKNYIAGPHYEDIENGTKEIVFNTNDINTVIINSNSNYVLINGALSIKKETWLEIKRLLNFLEFDETKG